MLLPLIAFLALCPLVFATAADAWVYPGAEWQTASPESQGVSGEALQDVAEYAERHGGGAGCVVRHGYIVAEWGDPSYRADIKSATKGSFGTTLLGVAVDKGLLSVDDAAATHYPGLGGADSDYPGWLADATVRHLATMTAGFDNSRPARLVYEPGSDGIYSNDGANVLAELLTLRFGEDLRDVAKREVMDRIEAPPSEWRWRDNAYRPDAVGSLDSREFASGITITYRALARVGYLYLRGGRWRDEQIVSADFLRRATRPTYLPAPWTYYAYYWGSNENGEYAGMPKDTYWASGLGDSFVVFCPSLDVVAVRLGTGSRASHLPGPDGGADWSDDWGGRVQSFFSRIVRGVNDPYPPSPAISRVTWDAPDTVVRIGEGADNWPMTWADDGHLYTAYGDGWGFRPRTPEKLSLGVGRVVGDPPEIVGENIPSESIERPGDGASGGKASGILMVDGVLYMWVRNTENSQLAWSEDHGLSWIWADWRFTESFGCPTFLNFGANYDGARDDYAYVVSQDADSAYLAADRMVMARVPTDAIRDRAAYEFFTGTDADGVAHWSAAIGDRAAAFEHASRCYRSGITYNPGLGRYLWSQVIPPIPNMRGRGPEHDVRYAGGFGIYDAPEPWGPWTTVFFTEKWDMGPGESSSLPTKWMSPDGLTCHLVFSGEDALSVRRVRFEPTRNRENVSMSGTRNTRVEIVDGDWHINGEVTYPGAAAKGLLMNVRMVNATFEDRNRDDFDSDANADMFLRHIPDYYAHGVRAFTLNLQGGMPGYEDALNSAIEPNGALRSSYLDRIARVIDACDEQGILVILGCFYQRQDGVFADDDAIRAAVRNTVRWIQDSGFTNVMLEVANEFDHSGFDHDLIKSVDGQVELIRIAKEMAPELLVSTSGLGHGRVHEP
ncbi:serine hydrolase, partial [Candidatus Poribacteria bacterium]|nr:serine hydrolase [Candidatus Poribacteria bacterium]